MLLVFSLTQIFKLVNDNIIKSVVDGFPYIYIYNF